MSKRFNYYPIMTIEPSSEDTFLLYDSDENNIKQVPFAYLPGQVGGELQFAGTWDASTNTPTVESGIGSLGKYYLVSESGNTTIDGVTSWNQRDIILFDGTIWVQIPYTDPYALAAESATESYHWAQYPEDQLVPEGNEVDEYSAYHWSAKSEDSASAASTSESNAATSASEAATSASNAATSESNAASSASSAATSASNAATSANNASISESNAASSATSASQSEQAAASSANYAGIWSNLTGSLSIPASVYHNGIMWTLLNNLTDVTTSEPTTSSSDWLAMYGMLEYPSIRPSLLLDFYSKEIDPRITFSRASNKSYYDHKGRLCYADVDEPTIDHDPVTGECKGLSIWESRTNLLTYSEDFDNAAWGYTGASITAANSVAAPDATTTADKLVADATVSDGNMFSATALSESTGYTFSCYAKAGEWSWLVLGLRGPEGVILNAWFDLTTGEPGVTSSGVTPFTESIGDGWYRCGIYRITGTGGSTSRQRIYPTNADNVKSVGDGTSGIYIWGAQLEEGSFPSSYIPSTDTFTSRASTATYFDADGVMQTAAVDEARYTYNPADLTAPATLLLEHTAATNLLTYSEDFDNAAWAKTRATIISNAATAPDGTLTGDKLVEDATADSTHYVTRNFTVTAGETVTTTVYARAGERNILAMSGYTGSASNYAYFDLSLGTVLGSNGVATIVSVGGGWYRCSRTHTMDALSTSTSFSILIAESVWDTTYTGDGTSGIYIWGAQLEEGSYPTSYIPTTSTAVTRAADISTSTATTRAADVAYIDGTDFSDFYNQNEGTVVVGFDKSESTSYPKVLRISDGTANNSIEIDTRNDQVVRAYIASNGSISNGASFNLSPAETSNILAISVKSDDFAAVHNGGSVSVDTDGTLQSMNILYIGFATSSYGFYNGHIRHLAYYPKALTDNNLIALTTEE